MGFLDLQPEAYGLSEALAGDLRALDELLGEVLDEQEAPELVEHARRLLCDETRPAPDRLFEEMPALRDPAKLRRVTRAYTVLFQLANAAEQKEIVRVNRMRAPRRESISEAVGQLKARGLSAEDAQDLVRRIEIAPTLTAHPTEAKRRAVLDKLQAITTLLAEAEAPPGLDERLEDPGACRREIRRTLVSFGRRTRCARSGSP